MKTNIMRFLLALGGLALALPLCTAQASEPALTIKAPVVLPRSTSLGDNSPLVRLDYTNIPPGRFTVKVWLLESATGNYFCASTQWCERRFKISNDTRTNNFGTILLADDFDVFDYVSFLWVARLYDEQGTELTSAQEAANGTSAHPPELKPVGRKSCVVGEQLLFKLASRGKATLSAKNLPPGAEFNAATGEFKWFPIQAQNIANLVFEASDQDTGLSDAEVTEIHVVPTK